MLGHHFIIAASGMLLLNTKLNAREGGVKLEIVSCLRKSIKWQHIELKSEPPWFGSDMTNIPPSKFIELQLKLLKPQTLQLENEDNKYQELTINLN